jgi:small multidrug resistance pump
MSYLYLAIAIVAEVIGTSALKATEGFTRPLPSLVVAVGYSAAFYFLSLALKVIPVGIAYAIWSGVGVALITLIGWLVFRQRLDAPALAGLALIVAGVVLIQFSSSGGAPR